MDVPLALWMSVLVGVVLIAALVAVGLWRATARPMVVAMLVGWLAIDLLLGMTGVFEARADRRIPLIALGVAVPLVAGVWALRRTSLMERLSPRWLIGVQVYRVIGVVFLVAWAQGRMPAEFALPAGLGDFAVGVVAPFVALQLDIRSPRSQRIARAWNLAGMADLVIAVTLGFLTSPSPFQQLALGNPNELVTKLPFVLIPTFAVPLSLLLHLAALRHQPAVTSPKRRLAADPVAR